EARDVGDVLADAVLAEVDALDVANERAHARSLRRALDRGRPTDECAGLAMAQRLALQVGIGHRVLRVLDERLVLRGARPLIAILVALAEIGERDVVVLDVPV